MFDDIIAIDLTGLRPCVHRDPKLALSSGKVKVWMGREYRWSTLERDGDQLSFISPFTNERVTLPPHQHARRMWLKTEMKSLEERLRHSQRCPEHPPSTRRS